jgi:hypothetical protein
MFGCVYGVVGDSPLPLVGLVETKWSQSYTFFYTPEKKEKVATLNRYFTAKHPDLEFVFEELASVNFPSEQVEGIASIFNDIELKKQPSAVFVTAGTKLMSMSILLHSQSDSMISLRSGLQYIVDGDISSSIAVPKKLTLDQILFSCGWVFDGKHLIKGGKKTANIKVEYNENEGVLVFIGTTIDYQQSERMVAFLNGLSEEFGRLGAQYKIVGKVMSKRALNIKPYFVHYIDESKEEEE